MEDGKVEISDSFAIITHANVLSLIHIAEVMKNSEKLCKLINCEASQLHHQTATLGATSTLSVSILRGNPSAFRSLRQQRISCDTSSGVSSGRGILCFSRRARIPSIASRILAMASSRLSPWLMHLGRAGHWMEYPMFSGSRMTVNFINKLRLNSIATGI